MVVADDHVFARAGLRAMLESAGDVEIVGEAEDGLAALELVRRLCPDVLLTDLRMPGLGGLELVAALTAEGAATRVIVVSAHVDAETAAAASRAGAVGCLPKDIEQPELIEAVRAAHRGEALAPPRLADATEEAGGATSAAAEAALTAREREVLGLVARGLRNKEIARELGIAEATVKFHVVNLLSKLAADSRTQAVSRAIALGIVRT